MNKLLLWLGLGFVGFCVLSMVGIKIYTTTQGDAIYEAVIRDIARDESSSQPNAKHVYFVQIYGRDPSPQFLQRFQGSGLSVRNASQGNIGTSFSDRNSATDVSTGEKGEVIKLGKISWINPAKPMAYSNSYIFQLDHQYGTWNVTERLMMVAG